MKVLQIVDHCLIVAAFFTSLDGLPVAMFQPWTNARSGNSGSGAGRRATGPPQQRPVASVV